MEVLRAIGYDQAKLKKKDRRILSLHFLINSLSIISETYIFLTIFWKVLKMLVI